MCLRHRHPPPVIHLKRLGGPPRYPPSPYSLVPGPQSLSSPYSLVPIPSLFPIPALRISPKAAPAAGETMNPSSTARMLTQLWFITVAVLAIAVLYLAKVLLLPLAFAILFAFLARPRCRHARTTSPSATHRRPARHPRLRRGCSALPPGRSSPSSSPSPTTCPLMATTSRRKCRLSTAPATPPTAARSEKLRKSATNSALPTPPERSRPAAGADSQAARRPAPNTLVQVREVGRPTGRLDQLGGIIRAPHHRAALQSSSPSSSSFSAKTSATASFASPAIATSPA